MKKNIVLLFMFSALYGISSCAAPAPTPITEAAPLTVPTSTLPPTQAIQVDVLPTVITPTEEVFSLEDVKFVTEFSDKKEDWQVIPGTVTAAQINTEVMRQEKDQMNRVEQKVLNGFLRTSVIKVEDGQVFEILSPAEIVNGKLAELKVRNVKQIPVLSSHAILLENYFAINFPEVFQQWRLQGAKDEDLKYAAVITISWATKYGPLQVSFITSGKYITETGKYPGRVDFLRMCMYEQNQEHYTATKKLELNLYAVPIIGLSGTTWNGITGEMKSDAFGWAPMLDFAKAQSDTLNEIGQAVSGVYIDSPETLAAIQSAFDRTFLPVHCAKSVLE